MGNAPDKAEQLNEEVNEEAIGPDNVSIPGVYPSGQVSEHGDAASEPTKDTRDADSLGDLTKEVSTSTVAEESGGMGSPSYGDEGHRNS